MHLEKFNLYHIFNQGNNRQKLFFCDVNYLFFIEKLRWHVLPYADVLAWCLMPNHFHLMVYVHTIAVRRSRSTTVGKNSDEATASSCATTTPQITFNKSIGIMLTSYTRAINIQENSSGSLFRPHTKSICLTEHNGITPTFADTKSGTMIYRSIEDKEYPQVCFSYIHENPVGAKLVEKTDDWPYSSASHYAGKLDDKLTCMGRAKEFGLI